MTLDYWWAHRNCRRACKLPDLNAPGEVELPGTPASRLAACLAHAHKQFHNAAYRRVHRAKPQDELAEEE